MYVEKCFDYICICYTYNIIYNIKLPTAVYAKIKYY